MTMSTPYCDHPIALDKLLHEREPDQRDVTFLPVAAAPDLTYIGWDWKAVTQATRPNP